MNPAPAFSDITTLYIVSGLSGLAAILTMVFIGIQTFKRQPPLEGQFADRKENDDEHAKITQRLEDLLAPGKSPFLLRAVHEAEVKQSEQILTTLRLINEKLDKFTEHRGETRHALAEHEKQISEIFNRINGVKK